MLIVEDDFHIALVIETALEAEGAEIVAIASRLDMAMESVRRAAPDIAVVDIRLGDTDSFPLVRKLRDAGTKIVLATGTEPCAALEEFSGVPVLKKPYTADELVGLIRGIL